MIRHSQNRGSRKRWAGSLSNRVGWHLMTCLLGLAMLLCQPLTAQVTLTMPSGTTDNGSNPVSSVNTGGSGRAGLFQNSNASNVTEALFVTTSSIGWALIVNGPIRGIFGSATGGSGSTYGVYGQVKSTAGYGVYGLAQSATGGSTGVFGQSKSVSGRGVVGWASAPSGTTRGVYGVADSTAGIGVYGIASATSGATFGGYFQSNSPDGTGILGIAQSVSGNNYGIRGESTSTAGTGILGVASSQSGTTYGVWGASASPHGTGVYGYAPSNSGTTYGVYGKVVSTSGYGMYSEGNLHIQGNLTASGSKAGFVADIVKNGGGEPLEPGDLVEIIGYDEPVLGKIPVIVVRKTTTAHSKAVLGPVAFAVQVIPHEKAENVIPADTTIPPHVARFHIFEVEGPIQPGDYGQVVTLGAFRLMKVDASFGAIHPGDLLVSSSNPGYAMAAEDPKIGTVVGKALGALESGIGEIPVLVSPR